MKKARLVPVLLVGTLALGGCTFVPTDSQPQTVNSRTVPFDLLARNPPGVTHTASISEVPRQIWFFDSNHQLVARTRWLPSSAPTVEVLASFVTGAASEQGDGGLSTFIPANLVVTGITGTNDVSIVHLIDPAIALEGRSVLVDPPEQTEGLEVRASHYEGVVAR